ncbi:Glycerophosphoryl diester phosphodiesterase [compost metagenome]
MACAPENTLDSFREAFAQGADGVECDVHLSADGQVVVLHDDTLDRTTSGHGPVDALPYAELRALDAGSWYASRFAGAHVPLLSELLALVKAVGEARGVTPYVVIELKAGSRRYPGIEAAVIDEVRKAGLGRRALFISFDHFAIKTLKGLAPELAGGILYHALPVDPVAMARAARADAVAPAVEDVEADQVRALHAAGLSVFAWTVRTPDEARRMAAAGVDAFGANAPGEILRAF